jgi:FKBP-type peptidyl-prolyl cis-trans isomerase SlyD
MSDKIISDGVVVSLAYTLTVEGETIEVIDELEPLEYLHGGENIVPGLERLLAGKTVGDSFSVTLEPEDAYGEYDENNVELIAREDLPDEIEAGMEVYLEADDGIILEAVVNEVRPDAVVLDLNHEFAGKSVTYDVKVLGLRPAKAQELAQGYPDGFFDDVEDHEH